MLPRYEAITAGYCEREHRLSCQIHQHANAVKGICGCRVYPVYQHVWPTRVAPTLSFIGLPWKVVPFPQFELVSRWIARVLSKRVSLPSKKEMDAWVEDSVQQFKTEGIPLRYMDRCCLCSQHERQLLPCNNLALFQSLSCCVWQGL